MMNYTCEAVNSVAPIEEPRTAHERIIAINGIQEKTIAILTDLIKTVNGADIGKVEAQNETCMLEALERTEITAEQILRAVDALRISIG